MKSQNFGFAVLFVSALALSGCETLTEPGAPDQSFDIDKDIQALEVVFEQGPTIEDFYASPTKEKRDRFVSGRLTLMNIQYIKFIRRFAIEKAQLDTAADILIIGVNLAGTLVGAASTKGILAAISGGTAASRTSINKNFFHEQTVSVLVTAMNAERKTALVPIMKGIGKSLGDYPFARALSDLNLYYQAGTFIGALQTIQKDSGAKEKEAEEKLLKILADQTFGAGENSAKIEKYLGWDGTQFSNAANVKNLDAWKQMNGISIVSNNSFLNAAEWQSLRAKAVEDLNIQ